MGVVWVTVESINVVKLNKSSGYKLFYNYYKYNWSFLLKKILNGTLFIICRDVNKGENTGQFANSPNIYIGCLSYRGVSVISVDVLG